MFVFCFAGLRTGSYGNMCDRSGKKRDWSTQYTGLLHCLFGGNKVGEFGLLIQIFLFFFGGGVGAGGCGVTIFHAEYG